MIDPVSGMIIASAISAAAQGVGSASANASAKRSAARKAKEAKRETYANLFSDSMQRNAELEGQRMQSGAKLGKRKSQGMTDTAAMLREAFSI